MHAEHPQSVHAPRLHLQNDAAGVNSGLHLSLSTRFHIEQSEMLVAEAELKPGIFAAGTVIDTPDGEWLIEQLAQGDEIRCFKNGHLGVQSCVALPDHCIPDHVVRIRSGYLNATADLITLPHQLIRLDHWLGSALFGTKFPFVAANCICLENKIELIPKPDTQFFKLDLGLCDAVTANGVLCISNPSTVLSEELRHGSLKNFEYRLLNSDEVLQALGAGSFFRKVRGKNDCQ